MTPTNTAAWLSSANDKVFKVDKAPYTSPLAGQIVVRNGAVAVNPVDGGKQQLGNLLLGHIKYPFIMGFDIAGEVVEVGPDVTRFHPGDRVLGHAIAAHPESQNSAEGGFQQYTILREHLATAIPDTITYEQACVVPLALVTAAYGLFHADYLALPLPTLPPPPTQEDRKQTLIITGGASSVGSNAIQLAVAAGYTVWSTSSPKNFQYVEKLGAAKVFDYHNSNYADEMLAELRKGGTQALAGAYAIGDGATEACIKILSGSYGGGGNTKKFIAFAGTLPGPDQLTTRSGRLSLIGTTLVRLARTSLLSLVKGVTVKFIDARDVLSTDGVVAKIFTNFLPFALANGKFVPMPPPRVVGEGVDKIQQAVTLLHKGVSAQKVIVTL